MENVLNNYARFVDAVTSEQSKNLNSLVERLEDLDENTNVNIARFSTACDGLSSESGELMEIKKKVFYQGKPLNNDTLVHIQKELGDILWYWVNACASINTDPYKIIEMNIEKLKSRYPGGNFDVYYSENRKQGDI